VIGRIADDQLALDPRTVLAEEDAEMIDAVSDAWGRLGLIES
jgi:hypothetical protein